jgi:hypothetical protein
VEKGEEMTTVTQLKNAILVTNLMNNGYTDFPD